MVRNDLSISSELERGVHVVTLAGELDLSTARDLAAALEAVSLGAAKVVVDLQACEFIDSSGLHTLAKACRRIGDGGGRLAVVTNGNHILRILEITGFEKLFPIYPTRQAALSNGFAGGSAA
jgi:anti-anti-sigma factor